MAATQAAAGTSPMNLGYREPSRMPAENGASPAFSMRNGLTLLGLVLGALLLVLAAAFAFPGHPSLAFAIFEAVVAGVALFIGRLAGLVGLGLLTILSAYFLLEGEGFSVADPMEALGLIGFVIAGLFLVAVIATLEARLGNAIAARETTRKACADKAVLLSEMSHRVFNDLGSLASLAALQARSAEQPETREALSEIADRIQVFAGVYKRLQADAAQTGALDMALFLEDLCKDLRTAHFGIRPIALELHAETCRMNVARAALVGLVLNESIMNALKYAFPDDRSGTIRVCFDHDPAMPNILCLTIEDDGAGPNGSAPKGTGMGQRLLRAMASQLGGSFALERHSEVTEARLRFPQS